MFVARTILFKFLPDAVLVVSVDAFLNRPNPQQCPHVSSRENILKALVLINLLQVSNDALKPLVVRVMDVEAAIAST